MSEFQFSEMDFTIRSTEVFYEAVDLDDFRDKDAETIYRYLQEEIRPIPFGDYLKRYLFKQMGMTGDFRAIDTNTYKDAIKIAFAENHTPKSFGETSAKIGALAKNWLSQAYVNRSVVFLLGFGLNMELKDVSDFLTKALLEYDINFKDPIEILCWYCFKKGYKFPKFEQLRTSFFEMKKTGSGAIYSDKTMSLRTAIYSINDDESLMSFLSAFVEPPGRKPFRVTTKEIFSNRYARCKEIIAEYYNADEEEREKSYSQRNWTTEDITEGDVEKVLMSGIPMDPNGNLVKMSSSSLGKYLGNKRLSRQHLNDLITEEVAPDRFDLITLQFFIYSQDIEYADDNKNRLFAFIEDTNKMLEDCGMGELYLANPYESFLMMCMVSDCPLATYADVWEMSYMEEGLSE